MFVGVGEPQGVGHQRFPRFDLDQTRERAHGVLEVSGAGREIREAAQSFDVDGHSSHELGKPRARAVCVTDCLEQLDQAQDLPPIFGRLGPRDHALDGVDQVGRERGIDNVGGFERDDRFFVRASSRAAVTRLRSNAASRSGYRIRCRAPGARPRADRGAVSFYQTVEQAGVVVRSRSDNVEQRGDLR